TSENFLLAQILQVLLNFSGCTRIDPIQNCWSQRIKFLVYSQDARSDTRNTYCKDCPGCYSGFLQQVLYNLDELPPPDRSRILFHPTGMRQRDAVRDGGLCQHSSTNTFNQNPLR